MDRLREPHHGAGRRGGGLCRQHRAQHQQCTPAGKPQELGSQYLRHRVVGLFHAQIARIRSGADPLGCRPGHRLSRLPTRSSARGMLLRRPRVARIDPRIAYSSRNSRRLILGCRRVVATSGVIMIDRARSAGDPSALRVTSAAACARWGLGLLDGADAPSGIHPMKAQIGCLVPKLNPRRNRYSLSANSAESLHDPAAAADTLTGCTLLPPVRFCAVRSAGWNAWGCVAGSLAPGPRCAA